MRPRVTIWTLSLLVFIIPFGAFAVYRYYERKFEELPIYGKTEVRNGTTEYHTIPWFQLRNQNNEVVSTEHWTGKIVIVDFFFTSCPVICPKMTSSLKKVQDRFSERDIVINSFSIDPERDSVGRLKSYAGKFKINNSNWHLLTGSKKDIYWLARNGFMIVATDGDGGTEDFIHSEKLVLIDRQRRIRGYYDGTNEKEVDNLIHDIKKLQNDK